MFVKTNRKSGKTLKAGAKGGKCSTNSKNKYTWSWECKIQWFAKQCVNNN